MSNLKHTVTFYKDVDTQVTIHNWVIEKFGVAWQPTETDGFPRWCWGYGDTHINFHFKNKEDAALVVLTWG